MEISPIENDDVLSILNDVGLREIMQVSEKLISYDLMTSLRELLKSGIKKERNTG